MRTKKEIIESSKTFVAKITGLGTTLVAGHKASYWEQAMQLAMEEWEIEIKNFNPPAELKQALVSGSLPSHQDVIDFARDIRTNAYKKLMETNNEYWKGEIVSVEAIISKLIEARQ